MNYPLWLYEQTDGNEMGMKHMESAYHISEGGNPDASTRVDRNSFLFEDISAI